MEQGELDTAVQRFKPVESCVDYKSYVYSIDPSLTSHHYAVIRKQLVSVGKVFEERMGVIYVRGPWGFFVVPAYGFPTLRASFFHDTPAPERNAVLQSIEEIFNKNT